MATKITKYVVAGVKADNEEMFVARVCELIEKKDLLKILTEGVPTNVKLVDPEPVLKYIKEHTTCKTPLTITSLSIDNDFNVLCVFTHERTRWYDTKEHAETMSWEGYKWKKDDDHTFAREETVTNNHVILPLDTEGILVEYI